MSTGRLLPIAWHPCAHDVLMPRMARRPTFMQVHLDRVERFIVEVGQHEDAIFQRRMRMLQRQKVGAPACSGGGGSGGDQRVQGRAGRAGG